MLIAVTRPREDAEGLIAALAARGHDVVLEPLLTIQPRADVDWPAGADKVQALAITSASGLRAFARLDKRRDLPVFAVGDASAAAARAAGFTQVASAAGTVEDLAQLLRESLQPAAGAILQPAASKLAGDLKGDLEAAGFEVLRAVLYDAQAARRLSSAFLGHINSGLIDAVTLFSPRTAATFASLIGEAGLNGACRAMVALCLSDAVAEQISDLPWRQVLVAGRPDQDALLARLDALAGRGE
ncbi:uroporphyrinogen-III synthase [Pelagibius litoralis]|uniref:Uroporphyrinogen-III synthase n=1 Tax=Pelagibius litoralis TaxID=374515 RepID=A0A967F0Y1_9PROT|nr:uroporphyrinogen-III synthase [Pelagibius litoralis]NIA71047.1 uroporphyrinogen-III synthase [Pelagibius litoralis]